MQTSMVFNQAKWPGAKDVDDCWVVSAIQCVHVTAPWLRLVGVSAFRKAAGDPDDGKDDGGTLIEIVRGVSGCYPSTVPFLRRLRGWTWSDFGDLAREHRPLSVAVISGKLPSRLQFGFAGYHQISLVVKADGTWLIANPLAPAQSRWTVVDPDTLRPAIMGYGRDKAGAPGAWAVAFGTDAEMAATWHAQDATPFDQADVDRITAAIAADRDELAGRIDAAQDALDG